MPQTSGTVSLDHEAQRSPLGGYCKVPNLSLTISEFSGVLHGCTDPQKSVKSLMRMQQRVYSSAAMSVDCKKARS